MDSADEPKKDVHSADNVDHGQQYLDSLQSLGYILRGGPWGGADEDDLDKPFVEIPRSVIIAVIIGAIVFAFLVFFAATAIWKAVGAISSDELVSFLSHWTGQTAGTVMVITLGSVLYLLRCARRAIYGLLEIGFASVASWVAVGQFHRESVASVLGIFTAAYLIVRGLDNVFESIRPPGDTDGA